jgi:hypothetical protein
MTMTRPKGAAQTAEEFAEEESLMEEQRRPQRCPQCDSADKDTKQFGCLERSHEWHTTYTLLELDVMAELVKGEPR